MLHAFGDCLSTDYFFNSNHEWKPRGFDTWPHVLGKLLDVPVNNLAKTGAGNWRTARILHSLDLNENDIVIIPWSFTWAIELGVSLRFDPKINPNDIDSVIYDAVEDLRKALEGLLAPKLKRHFVGRAEVRNVFKLSRSGIVAGCYIQKGKIRSKTQAEVLRNGDVVHTGHISTLKRFKDDVKEVTEGFECGITVSHLQAVPP